MLHSHFHHQHLLFSTFPVPMSLTHHHRHHHHHHYPLLHILHKPTKALHIVSAIPPAPWITQLSQLNTATIELPFSSPFILTATNDPSSAVQVASSVLLTGATAAFFFRSVLSRVKRVKQLKFRSSGARKSLDGLKAMQSNSLKAKAKPTPDQALLGAIIAGVMAIILYNVTTSIEGALSRQTISDNFSVRQVTITIRTMINGLFYLATFIYGFNSLGLLLYSGQLAINSFSEGSTGKETESKTSESNSSIESLTSSNDELSTMKEDQSPNKSH